MAEEAKQPKLSSQDRAVNALPALAFVVMLLTGVVVALFREPFRPLRVSKT